MAKVRFIRGPKAGYDAESHSDAVYFAEDSGTVYVNGKEYGAVPADLTLSKLSVTGRTYMYDTAVFSNGATFSNDEAPAVFFGPVTASKDVTVSGTATVKYLTVQYGINAKSIDASDYIWSDGWIRSEGGAEFNGDKFDVYCANATFHNGLDVLGDVTLSRGLSVTGRLDVGGEIWAIDGGSYFGAVACGDITCGNLAAEGEFNIRASSGGGNGGIKAEGDVVAPNITAMQTDINKLKRAVRIAAVKLYRGTADTNSRLRVLLDVDPSLFGEAPVLGSTCSVRVRVIVAGASTPTTTTLGTQTATLTTEAQGFTTLVGCERAIVRMQPFDAAARSFPSPTSTIPLQGELEVSTNVSGSYVVLFKEAISLTCVAEE